MKHFSLHTTARFFVLCGIAVSLGACVKQQSKTLSTESATPTPAPTSGNEANANGKMPFVLECETEYVKSWSEPRVKAGKFRKEFDESGLKAELFSDGQTFAFIYVWEFEKEGKKGFGFATVTYQNPDINDKNNLVLANGNALFEGELKTGINNLLTDNRPFIKWGTHTRNTFEVEGQKAIGSYVYCSVKRNK